MGSYYHTEADRKLVEEIALEYRDRLRYEPDAKRGRHWRLDGEEVPWGKLMLEFSGEEELTKWMLRSRELLDADETDSAEYRSLRKLGMDIPFQGMLSLLRERLGYWQSEESPF